MGCQRSGFGSLSRILQITSLSRWPRLPEPDLRPLAWKTPPPFAVGGVFVCIMPAVCKVCGLQKLVGGRLSRTRCEYIPVRSAPPSMATHGSGKPPPNYLSRTVHFEYLL